MRHGNVAYAFLYGFLFILSIASIIALAEYFTRRKIRIPRRQRRNHRPVIRDPIQPQNAHFVTTPIIHTHVVNTPVGTAARTVNRQPRTVNRVPRVSTLNPVRVATRIFRPRILPEGVPNPPRIIVTRRIDPVEIVLIEQKSQVRRTTWDFGVNEQKLRRFDLAYPQTDFKIVFFNGELNSVYVYYGMYPVSGADEDRLYLPNLTNVGPTGEVCMGHNVDQLRSEIRGFGRDEQIRRILEFFWYGSSFHFQHIREVNFEPWAKIEPRLSSLEEWERQTLLNPHFILSIDWAKRGKFVTVGEALNPFNREGG
jgi:hypothetical protein